MSVPNPPQKETFRYKVERMVVSRPWTSAIVLVIVSFVLGAIIL